MTLAGAQRPRFHQISSIAFPVITLLAFFVFVSLDLNGSSIGILSGPGGDSDLLAGTPRPERFDEFAIRTPNAVGSVRRGLVTHAWFGLVQVSQPAIGSPSRSWVELLRPHDWGYLLLGASRGLAWHWWFPSLVGLLGLYWLFVLLIREPLVSATLAMIGTMSPYAAWWSGPCPSLPLGYAATSIACALWALRTDRRLVSIFATILSGLLLAALALTPYVPWAISLTIVGIAVVVGQVVDRRAGTRRVALGILLAALAAAVPLSLFLVQNRAALDAIAGTIYPGQRISTAGGAHLSWLVDAALNPWLSGEAGASLFVEPGATGYAAWVNRCEVSASWLPLPVIAVIVSLCLAAVALGPGGRDTYPSGGAGSVRDALDSRYPATFVAVSLAFALLLAWAVLPLPSWVGALTLLNRVPPHRLPLALSFAALVLVALAPPLLRRARPAWLVRVLILGGVVATVMMTLWSGGVMPWRHPPTSTALVAVSGLAVAAGFAALAVGLRRGAAGGLLAAYCFWSWSLVNPLYRGLGPLDRDPVTLAMRRVQESSSEAIAAVYGDARLVALVASSGVQTLSGTTFYPDPRVWAALAPGQRSLWNNYATYVWKADRTRSPAHIRQIKGTAMELFIDPCAKALLDLGMTWVVSRGPLDEPCLSAADAVTSAVGDVHIYRVESSGG